jgi:hypothetical protein
METYCHDYGNCPGPCSGLIRVRDQRNPTGEGVTKKRSTLEWIGICCGALILLVAVWALIYGMTANPLSNSILSNQTNATQNLTIGNTARLSTSGSQGSLEVTVRSFDPATGRILIDEKNSGTQVIHYDPTIRIMDSGGKSYTRLYCFDPSGTMSICKDEVFITNLYPQDTETRNFSVYDLFQVNENGREGKLILYWSIYGQEASWIIRLS